MDARKLKLILDNLKSKLDGKQREKADAIEKRKRVAEKIVKVN